MPIVKTGPGGITIHPGDGAPTILQTPDFSYQSVASGPPPFTNPFSVLWPAQQGPPNSSRITIPQAAFNPDVADSFSISLWWKLDSAIGAGIASWFGNYNASIARGFLARYNNRTFQTYFIGSGGLILIQIANFDTGNLDVWKHLVWTYPGTSNANDMKVYLNGVSQSFSVSANSLSGTALGNMDGLIGDSTVVATTPWIGNLNQCLLYNTAINQATVDAIYNAGTPTTPPSTNLVHHWPLATTADTNTSFVDEVGGSDGVGTSVTKSADVPP